MLQRSARTPDVTIVLRSGHREQFRSLPWTFPRSLQLLLKLGRAGTCTAEEAVGNIVDGLVLLLGSKGNSDVGQISSAEPLDTENSAVQVRKATDLTIASFEDLGASDPTLLLHLTERITAIAERRAKEPKIVLMALETLVILLEGGALDGLDANAAAPTLYAKLTSLPLPTHFLTPFVQIAAHPSHGDERVDEAEADAQIAGRLANVSFFSPSHLAVRRLKLKRARRVVHLSRFAATRLQTLPHIRFFLCSSVPRVRQICVHQAAREAHGASGPYYRRRSSVHGAASLGHRAERRMRGDPAGNGLVCRDIVLRPESVADRSRVLEGRVPTKRRPQKLPRRS